MTTSNWKISDNNDRLIISNEKFWRSLLIYTLYSQQNRKENYFYINPHIDSEFIKQIIGTKPDPSSKWGDLPENWRDPSGNSHIFDVCKYWYLIKDFCLHSLKKSRYRFGQAPSILRQFERQLKRENENKDDSVASQNSSYWS